MPVAASVRIHPTATIDPAADLADGVVVGPQVIIEGPVQIGANTTIRPGAYLIGPMTIGQNNDIGKGVVLGERPQHLLYKGELTRTLIGDGNTFREYVTVHRAHDPKGATRIGDNNYLMANSHVAHDAILGNHTILANSACVAGFAEVHDRAFMSGLSGVHQYTRIGKGALVSGLASATKDVLPYLLILGRNGVVGVNVVGMRRAGISAEKILAVREAYRILYRCNLILKLAISRLERELGEIDIIADMLQFIHTSKRGIIASAIPSDADTHSDAA